jgi:hypothetical protein
VDVNVRGAVERRVRFRIAESPRNRIVSPLHVTP